MRKSDWISVKDELPDKPGKYMARWRITVFGKTLQYTGRLFLNGARDE